MIIEEINERFVMNFGNVIQVDWKRIEDMAIIAHGSCENGSFSNCRKP